MSKHTFEDYLMEKHAEQFTGTKDEMIGDFPNWLQDDLSSDELIEYGDKFAKEQSKELLECLEEAMDLLDEATLPEEREKFKQAITKAEGK